MVLRALEEMNRWLLKQNDWGLTFDRGWGGLSLRNWGSYQTKG